MKYLLRSAHFYQKPGLILSARTFPLIHQLLVTIVSLKESMLRLREQVLPIFDFRLKQLELKNFRENFENLQLVVLVNVFLHLLVECFHLLLNSARLE